jgi:uncharacterized protein YeaO (DUF488 family)
MAVQQISVGRVYDPVDDELGSRVLVDRLWPRGISKQRARLDEWCKDVAPSQALREWYGHEPSKFPEFTQRYHRELSGEVPAAAVAHLHELLAQRRIILLTATKDITISGARVLADLLKKRALRSTG